MSPRRLAHNGARCCPESNRTESGSLPSSSRGYVGLEGVVMTPTALRTALLGTTGLEISRVGFGAWAIGGGGYDWGWGRQEDQDSIAAIDRALELGVNWIDTAAQYGFGHSEQVVGRALAGLGEDERPYVFTKGGQPEGP